MDQNNKNVTTEIKFSIQGQSLKLALSARQTWNIALVIAIIKIALWVSQELG